MFSCSLSARFWKKTLNLIVLPLWLIVYRGELDIYPLLVVSLSRLHLSLWPKSGAHLQTNLRLDNDWRNWFIVSRNALSTMPSNIFTASSSISEGSQVTFCELRGSGSIFIRLHRVLNYLRLLSFVRRILIATRFCFANNPTGHLGFLLNSLLSGLVR
jgi:hypothetical protein